MKKLYLSRARSQIARADTIRSINRQIVLTEIRERGPISRASIARATTLNRASVSSIVGSLADDGFVEEISSGKSLATGRKPTFFRLKSGKPTALGVDITPRETTLAVADLTGKILASETFPTAPELATMSERLVSRLTSFIAAFAGEDLEIGISVPGIADNRTGRVLDVPFFDWKNWNVCALLTDKTGFPATVENDANATALAELWFGNAKVREFRNFVTVLVGDGIGTGIIFDGQVYRGDRGGAGEFGHMIIGRDAPVVCSCGSRDCWEAFSSEKATVARYREKSPGDGCGCLADIIDHALAGEPNAREVLRETGRALGVGISNLIVGLSPSAVVVSGAITDAWDIFAGELRTSAGKNIREGLPGTFLTTSALGRQPTLKGAIALVLSRKFAAV